MKYSIGTDDAYIAHVLIGLHDFLENGQSADIEVTGQSLSNLLSHLAVGGLFVLYAQNEKLNEFPNASSEWKLIQMQCWSLAEQIGKYFSE